MSSEEVLATIKLTKNELQATGFALALWRSEVEGVSYPHALALMAALHTLDHDVFMAHLDSACVKFAWAEDYWESDELLPGIFATAEEQKEARVRVRARLDQRLAQFAEQGRTMFREVDEDDG